MKIEFEWNDLVDLVDDASSDDINKIAHTISDIINVLNSGNVNDVDLSNYFTKDEVITEAAPIIISNYSLVATGDLRDYSTKQEVVLELGAMRDNFKETFIDLPWLSSVLSDYYTKGIVDIKIANIENLIGDIEALLGGI